MSTLVQSRRCLEGGDTIVKSRLNAMPGRLTQIIALESDPAIVQRLEKEVEGALDQLNKDRKDRG